MSNFRRHTLFFASTASLIAVFALFTPACRGATVCEPPGATSDLLVHVRSSAGYRQRIVQQQGDVPHVACRAEATIPTRKWRWRENEVAANSAPGGNVNGVRSHGGGAERVSRPPGNPSAIGEAVGLQDVANMGTFGRDYRMVDIRVMGVGRGMDDQDCAKAAVDACNQVIDAYWQREGGLRPVDIPCRALEGTERCPALGGSLADTAAAAAPKAPVRTEPPLVSLLKKLDDKQTRPSAILGLVQFFDNAMGRAEGNVGHPVMRSLLDQIVEPLTRVYNEGDLEEKTRVELIRVLGEARDERAGSAWIKACTAFAAGQPDNDVEWAALGMGATKYRAGAAALGQAFAKLEAGSVERKAAPGNVGAAMIALKDPAWKAMLLEKISRPVEKPAGSSDGAKSAAYQNELFWQRTSAEVLGEIRDAGAIKDLLKVLMDRDKEEIATSAALGIAAMGKDALPILTDVLAGKDAETVELARAKASNNGGAKSYVWAAAKALGTLGRPEASALLIKALKSADDEVTRAVVARELTKLPASAETEKAFEAAYEKSSEGATDWPSKRAGRPALLRAATGFYDAALVPWLLKQVKAAKGSDSEEVRSAGLLSAIQLMKPDQVPAVKRTLDQLGNDAAKEAFRLGTQLLESCDVAIDCYDAKLFQGGAQGGFASMKAAQMLGVLGDAKAATKIVERLAQLGNADARAAALSCVDHLARENSGAVADALEKWDQVVGGDATARQVAVRLRAR